MSAEEWSAAIMAGLESMEDQGSQLNNQVSPEEKEGFKSWKTSKSALYLYNLISTSIL